MRQTFSLAAALAIQLRMNRYVPWIYWLTVVLVSIVGTVPYALWRKHHDGSHLHVPAA